MSSKVSISGLVSNLDTDSIVSALVSAYSVKKDNYVKAQTKLEWKQDAWKELNTKIYNFYLNKLSPMRFSNAFSVKKSQSSSTKATVTAGSEAVSGTQKLKVNKLATSGYLTGAVVSKVDGSDGTKVTGKTTLAELGVNDGSSISVTVDGVEKNFTLDGSNTINEAIVKLKDAGVNASFDENNQRFFISSKVSGEKGDFSLTANNQAGNELLQKLGISSVTSSDIEKYRAQAAMTDDELASVVDTEYTKQKAVHYDISDSTAMDKVKQALENAKTEAAEANEKLAKQNSLIDAKLEAVAEVSGKTIEEKTAILESAMERIAELGAKTDRTEEESAELEKLQAKQQVYVAASNDTFDETAYTEELNTQKTKNEEVIAANADTIRTAESALADEEGFAAYIDAENAKIDTANAELKAGLTDFYNMQRDNAATYVTAYDLVNDPSADKTSDAYKAAAALVGTSVGGGTGAVRIVGEDSEIELNGATFTSNTNNFQINGLTITTNAVTEGDEEITITTETDVQGIYDMIKDFFTEYNNLIKEMDTLYNADSAKGYEPLTDDEKEAMTDTEVEKWEKKIKDSILRRDDTLQSVSDAMRNAFQLSYEINGKKYSLSSFGIKTSGYFAAGDNEKSMFHIDGDSSDSMSKGNTDKLMAAIASDPEMVCSFFNQLAQGVYDALDAKMKSTSLSSAYTVYNDKKMQNDYKEYSKTISKWEEKIEAYEEKYRKQFTAMETALAKLNSNSSALAGLLGS